MIKGKNMKSIYCLAAALSFAAAALVSLPAAAQSSTPGFAPDGVVLNKNVVEGSEPNTYTINLETFVTGQNVTIKTGAPLDVIMVLDFSTSLTGDNWKNLKQSAADFIKSIRDYKTQYKADARVGVLSFGSDIDLLTDGLIDPTSSSATNLIYRFENDGVSTGGSTRIDKGVEQAKKWFETYPNADAKKCVVVFTDGEPYGGSSPAAISKDALEHAYALKNTYNATVYTIGLLSTSDEDKKIKAGTNNNINPSPSYTVKDFLERLSSYYTKAKITKIVLPDSEYGSYKVTFSDWNSPYVDDDNYYQRAETSTLQSIFKNISEKVIGGASYEMTSATTTVIDVVAPAFKLPDGADGSKISLSVAECYGIESTGVDGSVNYLFREATPAKDIFPTIEAEVGVLTKTIDGDKTTVTFEKKDGGKAVSVTGFDFSENFVGPRESDSGLKYGGYKLIISFPIEIDPSNPGGATQNTNTEDSGIYCDQGDGNGYQQIGGFEIPVVKIPNIVVIKNGLRKGDSAIFNVYKVEKDGTKSQFPITLVATCKEDGKPAITKTKIQKTGRYMIEETSWSWAYDISTCQSSYPGHEDSSSITTEQWHEKGFGAEGETGYVAQIPFKFGTEVTANAITRNVNDFTEEENTELGYKGTLFIFNNKAKTSTPAHDEAIKNNVFYKCK